MYQKLDSLRGLIALTMALFHSQFFIRSGGSEMMHNAYLCVDMLFVLSGFIISANYGERIRNGFNFSQFLIPRIARLYPLHAVMMLIWLCYILMKQALYEKGFGGNDPLKNNDPLSFFGSLFMLHSMGLFDRVNWNVPSWSIGALLLTYASFYAFCKIAQSTMWLKALLLAIIGYGFIGLVLRKTDFDITYDYGFLRCLAGFYLGVFCYGLTRHVNIAEISAKKIALLELLALAAFLFALEYAERSVIVLYSAVPLLGAIILLFTSRHSGFIGKLLELPLLQWVGSLAFSIYLTHYIIVLTTANFFQYVLHWPMQQVREQYGIVVMGFVGDISIVVNIFLVLCILAVSALTQRYVEAPCRRWSRAFVAQLPSKPMQLPSKKILPQTVERELIVQSQKSSS